MKDKFLNIYKQYIKRPGSDELLKWLEAGQNRERTNPAPILKRSAALRSA